MKNHLMLFIAGGIAVLFAALPLFAHHSFAAEYDANKPITLKRQNTRIMSYSSEENEKDRSRLRSTHSQ